MPPSRGSTLKLVRAWLHAPGESAVFQVSLELLRDRIPFLLFQRLPSFRNWEKRRERTRAFLREGLGAMAGVEFRHPTWWDYHDELGGSGRRSAVWMPRDSPGPPLAESHPVSSKSRPGNVVPRRVFGCAAGGHRSGRPGCGRPPEMCVHARTTRGCFPTANGLRSVWGFLRDPGGVSTRPCSWVSEGPWAHSWAGPGSLSATSPSPD